MNEQGRRANLAGEGAAQCSDKLMASRELIWSECSLEQKIERLRDVLLQTRHLATGAAAMASSAEKVATEHLHGGRNGFVVMPPQRSNSGMVLESFDRPRGYKPFDPLA